jgi:hypothetical protein
VWVAAITALIGQNMFTTAPLAPLEEATGAAGTAGSGAAGASGAGSAKGMGDEFDEEGDAPAAAETGAGGS